MICPWTAIFMRQKKMSCTGLTGAGPTLKTGVLTLQRFVRRTGKTDKNSGRHCPRAGFAFDDDKDDTVALRAKAKQLTRAGADGLVLMFDDISMDLSVFERAGIREGQAHARLATRLQAETSCPVFLVPRLYADEIEGDHAAYAADLNQHLAEDIAVFTCGMSIVAEKISLPKEAGVLANKLQRPLIIWDNLYCNDYCPRRLFTGRWTGRKAADPILLNGTGMPETDKLLLGLMAGKDRQTLFIEAGVPTAFTPVESYFWHPTFSGQPRAAVETKEIRVPFSS